MLMCFEHERLELNGVWDLTVSQKNVRSNLHRKSAVYKVLVVDSSEAVKSVDTGHVCLVSDFVGE
jgi:hypothetical protein